jgi:hypothetical protein
VRFPGYFVFSALVALKLAGHFFAHPADVVESVYFLTQQPRSAWTFELDLRPFGETW